jgi:single-strand DNA-binding protein
MPFSSGVNRVFLVGQISDEPEWQVINQQRLLCFLLATVEDIKKDGGSHKHTELHHIKIPPELITDDNSLKPGDLLYVQGKLQTRIVYENGVKLYKTEVFVTSFEKLKFTKESIEIV